MTFDEFIDRADHDYEQLVQDLLLSWPSSAASAEAALKCSIWMRMPR